QILPRPLAAVADPAMPLAAPVLEARARGWVRERVEGGLHEVDRLVQVVVVHVADGDVQLAGQLRAQLSPVATQVVREIVVLAPVRGDLAIDLARDRVPDRRGVAVRTHGAEHRLPDRPLPAGTAVGADGPL